ncbi:hypothetical protein PC9H_001858 [Pleurotus ostreatus]|uniref:Nucleic-acid-binding protein from transposon X-element n=1 Tax=Pleurotus ostreatus TaxID=5322 RepID=A0A8H7DPW6_PLEOS|nr:uncharacterized protein PC9H_001858 [Pleurotus ostreatus]KAF7419271.1 hypothetical protein PC9H_001858 [Pleurotus ostreatus]
MSFDAHPRNIPPSQAAPPPLAHGAPQAQPINGSQCIEPWVQLPPRTPPPRPPSAYGSEFGDPASVPNLDEFYVPLTGHADATPTRKRARVEASAAPLSLNPPNVSAAIRQGGGTKHISCAEWRRICVQVLEDIVEGARKMLGWSDEAEAMHEILNVAKVMKTALSELDGSVSVDNDIFMSQPAMPSPPHGSSLDAFKLEVKDLFRNLEANISARISNVERHLSSGSASSQPTPPAHNGSNTRQQPSAPTTYAAAAKVGPPGQPKPAQQSKATSTPPAAKPNTKFIVCFQGRLPPEVDRKSSQFLFHHLNQVFNNNAAARNDGLEILGAEWNRSGNIVLTFPSHVNPSVVYNHTDLIHSIVDHNLNDVIISHDTKWSKAVCSRVPSMGFDGHYWDSKALGVLLRRNPVIKNLKITQEPRFVSNPADGLPPVAPVVFAFEDPDGSKLKELLKTPIFMDGRHTPVHPWREKPKLTQCDRCQGLGHTAKLCNKPNVCAKCAQRHPTTEHNVYCPSVLKDGSSTCKCTPRCANCEGDHWATEPSCPEKRKYVPRPAPPPPPQASQARQQQLQMPARPAPPPPMQVDK